MNKKKIAFTIIVAVIALSALCWVFWLVFYFDSTIDGSIVVDLTNEYILFERNYLCAASDFWNNNCIDDIYIHILLEAKKEEKKMPNFANTLHTAILVFVRLPFEFDNNLL